MFTGSKVKLFVCQARNTPISFFHFCLVNMQVLNRCCLMHGKKSFKGESKSERNGKNTAKLLKYYTPCWMLLHLLLVYHYTSEAQRNGETMYTCVLFSGLI